MKKRSFSLIEMIISLGLLGVLITTLFFWYQHAMIRWKKSPIYFQEQTQEYYLFHQFETYFSHLAIPSSQGHPYFYTEEGPHGAPRLFFTYDRGIDSEPEFSGVVLAQLHLTDRELIATLWPHPQYRESISPRHYCLLRNVDTFSCRALAIHRTHHLVVQPDMVGVRPCQPGWHSSWPLEWEELPALIQISISGDQEYCWIFDTNLPILYAEEQIVGLPKGGL